MKKLNLVLITLFFSSLLIGCGMKGPLYQTPENPPAEKQQTQKEAGTAQEEKNKTP